ncbi:hypothetical protein [Tessaracoccus massiliensis]|uniref:hypothetical protein n=1 Tax=Tessaracoccus massiliensis TaxID=1522311 RepID=UPI00058D62B7|nr:hypothetical protein [Tessaracoccus massiliensis]
MQAVEDEVVAAEVSVEEWAPGGEDRGWLSLAIGLAGFLLGTVPLLAFAVRQGIEQAELTNGFRLDVQIFSYDHWTRFAAFVLMAAFTALGLRWARRRQKVPARPAVFVLAVGMLLLVVPAVTFLTGRPSSAGPTTAVGAGMLVVYVLYAALVFWLLTSRSTVAFTVGAGLLFLPGMYWLNGLAMAASMDAGALVASYTPFLMAALMGLTLGRCGWRTGPRLAAWATVTALMTLGYAGQSTAEFALASGQPEYVGSVFQMALQFSLLPAGIALLVGALVASVEGRRRERVVDAS